METKRGMVKEVLYQGTFQGKHGILHKHDITFEDGTKGQYSSKSENQSKFVTGKETDYEFHPDERYPKIKPISQQNFQSGGGNNRDPVAEKKRQVIIVLQSQMERAMEFHLSNGYTCSDSQDLDQMKKETVETMEYFAETILKNKYINLIK